MSYGYKIVNTEHSDLKMIYQLFEEAIEYIKRNNYIGWTTYDKTHLIKDLENKFQFKIIIQDKIAAVFSICFSDALIWRKMEKGDSIYLHRIVVNPEFKGQKQFDKILNWSKKYATKNELKYIRMDTWAANPNIIEYYKSFGFSHVEDYITSNSSELPEQHRNLKVALLELKL